MTAHRFFLFDLLPPAVEGAGTFAAQGSAAGVAQDEPDADWQPL